MHSPSWTLAWQLSKANSHHGPQQLENGNKGKHTASPCSNFRHTHQQTPATTGISYQQRAPNLSNQPDNNTSNKHNGHNTLGQSQRKTTPATQTMETTHSDNTKGKIQTGHY
jgi:hypothetical protein